MAEKYTFEELAPVAIDDIVRANLVSALWNKFDQWSMPAALKDSANQNRLFNAVGGDVRALQSVTNNIIHASNSDPAKLFTAERDAGVKRELWELATSPAGAHLIKHKAIDFSKFRDWEVDDIKDFRARLDNLTPDNLKTIKQYLLEGKDDGRIYGKADSAVGGAEAQDWLDSMPGKIAAQAKVNEEKESTESLAKINRDAPAEVKDLPETNAAEKEKKRAIGEFVLSPAGKDLLEHKEMTLEALSKLPASQIERLNKAVNSTPDATSSDTAFAVAVLSQTPLDKDEQRSGTYNKFADVQVNVPTQFGIVPSSISPAPGAIFRNDPLPRPSASNTEKVDAAVADTQYTTFKLRDAQQWKTEEALAPVPSPNPTSTVVPAGSALVDPAATTETVAASKADPVGVALGQAFGVGPTGPQSPLTKATTGVPGGHDVYLTEIPVAQLEAMKEIATAAGVNAVTMDFVAYGNVVGIKVPKAATPETIGTELEKFERKKQELGEQFKALKEKGAEFIQNPVGTAMSYLGLDGSRRGHAPTPRAVAARLDTATPAGVAAVAPINAPVGVDPNARLKDVDAQGEALTNGRVVIGDKEKVAAKAPNYKTFASDTERATFTADIAAKVEKAIELENAATKAGELAKQEKVAEDHALAKKRVQEAAASGRGMYVYKAATKESRVEPRLPTAEEKHIAALSVEQLQEERKAAADAAAAAATAARTEINTRRAEYGLGPDGNPLPAPAATVTTEVPTEIAGTSVLATNTWKKKLEDLQAEWVKTEGEQNQLKRLVGVYPQMSKLIEEMKKAGEKPEEARAAVAYVTFAKGKDPAKLGEFDDAWMAHMKYTPEDLKDLSALDRQKLELAREMMDATPDFRKADQKGDTMTQEQFDKILADNHITKDELSPRTYARMAQAARLHTEESYRKVMENFSKAVKSGDDMAGIQQIAAKTDGFNLDKNSKEYDLAELRGAMQTPINPKATDRGDNQRSGR